MYSRPPTATINTLCTFIYICNIFTIKRYYCNQLPQCFFSSATLSNTEVDYTYKQPFLYKCNQYIIVSFYKQCIPSHNFNTIYFDSKCIHHFSVFTSYCNITFHYCTHINLFFIKQYHLHIITPFSRIYMLNIETVLYYCNAIFYAGILCCTFIAMYIVMSKCRKKRKQTQPVCPLQM